MWRRFRICKHTSGNKYEKMVEDVQVAIIEPSCDWYHHEDKCQNSISSAIVQVSTCAYKFHEPYYFLPSQFSWLWTQWTWLHVRSTHSIIGLLLNGEWYNIKTSNLWALFVEWKSLVPAHSYFIECIRTWIPWAWWNCVGFIWTCIAGTWLLLTLSIFECKSHDSDHE